MKKTWFLTDYRYLFACARKSLLIMRISIFLVAFASLQTFAVDNYAQTKKIDLKVEQANIVAVLEKIQDESEFYFFYNNQVTSLDKKVSVNLKDKSINDLLDEVFKGTDVEYVINNRQIILSTNPSSLNQQQKSVSGKVTDSTGAPLPGVSILVVGTTNGTITDSNGKYTLGSIPENGVLQYSFIGMTTQQVTVGSKSTIDVVLADETTSIDEVVAVGYGTVKKKDLTGSVSSVSSADLGDRLVSDVGSLIQGKVSGVDVSQGQIRVRGVTTFNNTDPLIVIDGFIGGNMNTVNANDIQSIEILKDASSTAIYGSRGANGVVLITTKGGKVGPLKVSVNAFTAWSKTPKTLPVLNASQYIDYMDDVLTNGGQSLTPELLDPVRRNDVTFWQDEVFKTGRHNEIDLDFAGGSDRAKYFMSIGYKYDESIVIGPQSNQVFIRNKNDFNISKWLRFGNNFAFNFDANKGTQPWDTHGMIGMPPYYGVYDPSNLGGYTNVNRETDLVDVYNPIPFSALNFPKGTSLGYQTNLWTEIEPIKGLIYRIQAGVSGNYGQNKTWQDEFINGGTQKTLNGISEGSSYSFMPLIENTLTFSKEIGKHNFSAMIGNTWQDYAYGGSIGIYGQEFDNTEVKNVFLAKSKNISEQSAWNYAYLSYFGRINYQYNNKYLATFNIRRDGSPRFAPQNRWGNFPSLALAWKMHEESFIKDLGIFDQLKLRASWGVSGNVAIGNFRYVSRVWTNGVYYPLGGVPVPGATVAENASVDIKWESTESKNIGIDAAFFKNALTLTADYFVKNTNDILFTVPRPSSLGYGMNYGGDAVINAASLSNKGFEIQVGYKGQVAGIHYSVNANYTNVTNNVDSLGLGQPYLSGVSRTDVGNPIGYFYGFVADGVFETKAELDAANAAAVKEGFESYQEVATGAGDARYKDLNGDGHITWDDDRQNIGNSIPKHLYGLNLTADYRGFDFNAYFQGVAGSDIFYGSHSYLRGGITTRNQEAYVLDRWISEAEPGNGIVPRAVIGDPNNNSRPSTLMVSSGNYLKLRQLSLGYTLPETMIGSIGIQNARLYVSANNVFTISDYHGFDPEVGGDNLNRGIDNVTYPNPRSIAIGIQIGF